jgi:hypothetical protein
LIRPFALVAIRSRIRPASEVDTFGRAFGST